MATNSIRTGFPHILEPVGSEVGAQKSPMRNYEKPMRK